MPGLDTSFYTQAQPNALFGTAQSALGVQNTQLNNQLLNTQNQGAHLDLLAKKQGQWNNMVSSLMADPEVSYDKVMATGQQGVQLGFFGPDMLAKESQIFAPTDTPQQIQQKLQVIATRGISGLDNLNRNAGQPGSVDTGSNTVFGTQSIHGFTPQSSMQHGMSPSDANALVPVTMPDGSTRQMTKAASVAVLGGGNALTAPEAAQPANPLVPQAPAAAQPVALAAPAMPGISAPSPQQQKMFDASGAQYQAAKVNDANFSANLVPLQKSLELLPDTPLFGKGAEIPTAVAQVFNTFGIPIGSDQSKNASELDKYLTQIARSSGAAANSDAQLIAGFSANPNMSTDKAAAQDVIKTMISLQRMQHAAIAAAQAKNISPEGYSDFARELGSNQDPRAYGVDLMSPEAKQVLLKELQGNPAVKAKFLASLKIADQAQVLGAGGGQ